MWEYEVKISSTLPLADLENILSAYNLFYRFFLWDIDKYKFYIIISKFSYKSYNIKVS